MVHFNPAVDPFERTIADFRIDQAIFHRVIIVGEARGVLSQGSDVAGLILLNKCGERCRIGGIKDVITRGQKLDELAKPGWVLRSVSKRRAVGFFFCSVGQAEGVASSGDASVPNIRVRRRSLKGERPGVGPGLGGDTNSRNGRSKKTLSTQYEDVELVISRDLYVAK